MAYDRTMPRLKMPPGRREMSLCSRPSSTAIPIFVVLAILPQRQAAPLAGVP